MINSFFIKKISDQDFKNAAPKYAFNTPQTKEALYYRQIFEEFYPGCEHFTPYMWLPKWCGNVTDPSARILKHYTEQQQENQQTDTKIKEGGA